MIYGYIRVSSTDQNTDRQHIAMKDHGVPYENIFVDKQSGKNFVRPAYQKLFRKLKKSDLLVIKSIDRLGRNYGDVMEEWRQINKVKQADIKVLDMPLLDTTLSKDLLGTFISDLVLQLLSFVAENERTYIRQRQAEGIAAAKQRNVRFGRPKISQPDNFHELVFSWNSGLVTVDHLSEICGASRSTIYRWLKDNQNKEPSIK